MYMYARILYMYILHRTNSLLLIYRDSKDSNATSKKYIHRCTCIEVYN